MPPLPPRVVGPLSECSTGVRVKGQVPGAEIEVFADGTKVAEGTAGGATDTFPLTDDLSAGQEVTATQTTGGATSDPTPEPVEVQAEPPEIPPVAFRTETYECGECVWLDGLVPGATARVEDDRGVLGGESSYDGHARIHLSDPFEAGEDPVARQTACGRTGPEIPAPGPRPIPGAEHNEPQLPPPVVEADLMECEEDVTVHGVLPGAHVTLERSGGPNPDACFDLSRLQFPLANELNAGETLLAYQEFPACDVRSPDSDDVEVDPTNTVPEPDVREPLCAGGTTVTVTGMHTGKRVEIVVVPSGGGPPPGTGTTYEGAAPDSTFDFPIPALPANADVYVRQRLCNQWSDFAGPFEVGSAPGELEPPRIDPAPFECGTVVHVENCHPGSRVYVYSQLLGAPIGSKQVYETETDVHVAPTLRAGDELFAVARGCGDESEPSETKEVRDLEELPPPTVEQPDDCGDDVVVTDVVPGARVEVYVDGVRLGGAASGDETVTVTVGGDGLQEGEEVRARQRLCGRESELSRPVPVERYEGEWRQVGGEQKAEIIAIHAALLPTGEAGEVVYFGGDQHHDDAHDVGDVDHTRVYDVGTEGIATVTGLTTDVFCAGHATLQDGSLLTGGGTAAWLDDDVAFYGSRAAWWFDHSGSPGSWNRVEDMVTARPADVADGGDREETGGRWYPTLVTLPDGRVLAVGGEPEVDDTRDVNSSLELFDPYDSTGGIDPANGSWDDVGGTDYANVPGAGANADPSRDRQGDSEYVRLHVLPDGSVLSASEMDDGSVEKWNPYTDPTDWTTVANGLPSGYDRGSTSPQNYTSALLPLRHDENWDARVLLADQSETYVFDPDTGNTRNPSRTLSGSPTRHFGVATLLPTGEVALTGGVTPSGNDYPDGNAVHEVELFDARNLSDPTESAWRTGPPAEVARNYHSVALLLPDGSVWTAGSNHDANAGGPGVREYRIEIYEPWYFCEDRPGLSGVPDSACHGESFTVESPDADRIEELALVRCGSVTHAWNPDQRHVTLDVTQDGDVLSATVPDAAVAVPGHYVLFAVDDEGVPSEGQFVEICRDTADGVDEIIAPPIRERLFEILRRLLARFRGLFGRL